MYKVCSYFFFLAKKRNSKVILEGQYVCRYDGARGYQWQRSAQIGGQRSQGTWLLSRSSQTDVVAHFRCFKESDLLIVSVCVMLVNEQAKLQCVVENLENDEIEILTSFPL